MNPLSTHLFQEDLYYFTAPIVVVLARAWETYTAEERRLLQKILTSVKVDLNAVQMVVQPSIELKSLLVYSPARVLIFGSETRENIATYQETPAQGFTVVRADDLNQLDEEKKKNLWNALRRMFGA
ncbi:MAG: DNA polymerase III subunit psi [Cyclobacteriaceae bacterium]